MPGGTTIPRNGQQDTGPVQNGNGGAGAPQSPERAAQQMATRARMLEEKHAFYQVVDIDLDKARTDERVNIQGAFAITVWTDGTLNGISLKVNHRANTDIPLNKFAPLFFPEGFNALFITNQVQTGKTATLFLSTQVGVVADPGRLGAGPIDQGEGLLPFIKPGRVGAAVNTANASIIDYTVPTGQVLNIKEISLISDQLTKVDWTLTLTKEDETATTLFTDQFFQAAVSFPFGDNQLVAGDRVQIWCKATDGTSFTADATVSGAASLPE